MRRSLSLLISLLWSMGSLCDEAASQQCRVGPWEAWSMCDVECGGGMQRHGRRIISPGAGASSSSSSSCPRLEISRACHTQPCAESTSARRLAHAPCSWRQSGTAAAVPCTPCVLPRSRNGAGEYEVTAPTPTSDRVCAALTVCGAYQYIMLDAGPRAPRVCVNCPFGTRATEDHSACYAYLCTFIKCAHIEHKCSAFATDASTRARGDSGVGGSGCDGQQQFQTTVTQHDARREAVCRDGHWCGLGIATGDKGKCECSPLSLKPADPAPAATVAPYSRTEAQRQAASPRPASAAELRCARGFSGHECACENGTGIGRCDSCENGFYLASVPEQVQRVCAPWGGVCAHGSLVAQWARTADSQCGLCDLGFFLSERRCLGWGGICHHGELAAQAARVQENQCGTCEPGYRLEDARCIPYAGHCDHGTLVAQALRMQADHCGECNAGYCLSNKACVAYGGSCAYGTLAPQSARRMEGHCGSCDDGYFLLHFTHGHVCAAYGGECAHGELPAQAARVQENQCVSCESGFALTHDKRCVKIETEEGREEAQAKVGAAV